MTRRALLKSLLKSLAIAPTALNTANWRIAGKAVRVFTHPVTARTMRISVVPIGESSIPEDGSLMLSGSSKAPMPELLVSVAPGDLSIRITEKNTSRLIQSFAFNDDTGAMTFDPGEGPVLGLGEGGAQFDRRGVLDEMHSGQGGYKLRTHGGRVPIPWLIGTSGWAIFVHQPYGTFDLTGAKAVFRPNDSRSPLPIDLFVTGTTEPKQIMEEYANLTGHPEMPPLWSLGYHQSHRTLAGPDEILTEAKTFREKALPCDSLIFLGTGFCPSGWNTCRETLKFFSCRRPLTCSLLSKLRHGGAQRGVGNTNQSH